MPSLNRNELDRARFKRIQQKEKDQLYIHPADKAFAKTFRQRRRRPNAKSRHAKAALTLLAVASVFEPAVASGRTGRYAELDHVTGPGYNLPARTWRPEGVPYVDTVEAENQDKFSDIIEQFFKPGEFEYLISKHCGDTASLPPDEEEVSTTWKLRMFVDLIIAHIVLMNLGYVEVFIMDCCLSTVCPLWVFTLGSYVSQMDLAVQSTVHYCYTICAALLGISGATFQALLFMLYLLITYLWIKVVEWMCFPTPTYGFRGLDFRVGSL